MMRPNTVQWKSADGRIFLKPDPALNAQIPGEVDIIDQTCLPGELTRITLSTPEEVYDAIQRLAVRGAPAIGCAAALGLAACAQRFEEKERSSFLTKLKKTADYLESSRPTAVNLAWALHRCCRRLDEAAEEDVSSLKTLLLNEALTILDEDIAMCRAIGRNGLSLIRDGMGILTHCNAGALATCGWGTALGVIKYAHQSGKNIRVYADETRPRLQGARLTAWELARAGIPATLIADSTAASLIRDGKIDCVILGADRITAQGDVANKLGTFALSVICRHYGVPFYSAAPTSTIDFSIRKGEDIPIEERDSSEITHIEGVQVAACGVGVYNPAFDVTPHQNITGIITECGIIREPYDVNLEKLRLELGR